MIRICLLGPITVDVEGELLRLPGSRNARALLGLLSSENGPQARSLLAERLWPDSSSASARTSLSTELYKLRRALGPAFDAGLAVSRDRLGLSGSAVWIDIREFDNCLTRGDMEGARNLWRGTFMQDTSGEWVERRRQDYLRRHAGVLRSLAQQREAAGDVDAAVAMTYEWVALDGSDGSREQLIVRLMRSGDGGIARDEHQRLLADLTKRGVRPESRQIRLLSSGQGAVGPHLSQASGTTSDDGSRVEQPTSEGMDDEAETRSISSIDRLIEAAFDDPPVIRTGFVALDRLLGSLPEGLVIVGARPSTGTTAFLLSMAVHAAVVENRTVALFSPDLPERDVAHRLLAGMARIPLEDLQRRTLPEARWVRLLDTAERLSASRLHVDDSYDLRVETLLEKLEELRQEVGSLGLVLVDDFRTLCDPIDTDGVSITADLMRLRSMGRRLAAPVVAVVPVSPRVEARYDKTPRGVDLPPWVESARPELVLLLHREELWDKETEREGIVDVIVEKNRRGSIGQVELVLTRPYGALINYSGDD